MSLAPKIPATVITGFLGAGKTTLIRHLIQNAGWVVPHETLLTKVWGHEYINDNHLLRLYITYLRKKIEEDPSDPQYIFTERGLGYRFVDFENDEE